MDRIATISQKLGVTEEAAKTLLRIVGEQPDVPNERLAEALTKVANDYKRLQAQAAALNPDNPTARELVSQGKAEIDTGHFAHARELLRQATQVQIAAAQEARKLREQAQAAEDAQMSGAAKSTATEADVALTERHYAQAAELFAQAAGYVPPGQANERLGYVDRQAEALFRLGDERGDNRALQSSIELYRRILEGWTRDRAPLDWVRVQNALGMALSDFGDREMSTIRLEEAVAAYRAALEETVRDRLPLRWATIQNNLGVTLSRLGERESGTARLEEAAAAHRAALEEWTRERVPQQWAMAQMNLGAALWKLGERESGTTRLEGAVAAYRAALEEWTRDRVPQQWAMVQMNLGNALRALGEREGGVTRLEEAVAAYRAVLEEVRQDHVPLQWALAQMNLGTVLFRLGERANGMAQLQSAIEAFRAALEEATRVRAPLLWARTQLNSGCRTFESGRTRRWDAAADRGCGGESRSPTGDDARGGSARMGAGADEPRQRAFTAR